MRAILLAAGLGTRLRPLTNQLPKCLVPIHGEPLLSIWLKRLADSGIGPFLINTHYLSEQVDRFVEKSIFKEKIQLVHESSLLGTAGTLIENLSYYQGEDGLLIHADNYCLSDFLAFQYAHKNRPADCLITMMTFRTDDPSSCGIVELDERGVVVEFHEKISSPPGNLANAAVYIISNEFLSLMRSDFTSAINFSEDVLPNIVGHIFTYETNKTVIDIGTADSLNKANALARNGLQGQVYINSFFNCSCLISCLAFRTILPTVAKWRP